MPFSLLSRSQSQPPPGGCWSSTTGGRRRSPPAFDPVVAAGPATEAFRRFRSTLDGESRFALVFGQGVDRNERGTYRLVGGYYLYPAIAVAQPIDADAVMVFGSPRADVRRSFEEVAVVDGVWLGRRP